MVEPAASPAPSRFLTILLWVVAFVVTVASAAYQRRTGPTYPVSMELALDGAKLTATLPRTHPGEGDAEVRIAGAESGLAGTLVWRRYRSHDPWLEVPLEREGDELVGRLPHQPPAGKIQYWLRFRRGEAEARFPEKGEEAPVIIRFRGDVPAPVIILHVFFMFAGMLVSTRAGLQALRPGAPTRKLAIAAAGLLFMGGMIFGPIMQKYAFGAYWTGWPVSHDLTDNKTLIAMIAWVIALIAGRKGRDARYWVLAASVVTFAIFLIPHSVRGSELDYTAME
jgi:hypothetical protein